MLDFIYNRTSVRRFTQQPVKQDDLQEILKATVQAPSGKNLQNWHIVVVENKAKISQIANVIIEKNKKLASIIEDEDKKNRFEKFVSYATLFKNAPITVLFYAGHYPATAAKELEKIGDLEALEAVRYAAPGIQSVSAAIENFMLSATALGYGTCWMTSQNYAIPEIEEIISLNKEGYRLIAISPLGVPEKESISPPRKELDEVVTILK